MKLTFLGTGTSQGIPVIACNCEVCLSENPKDNRLRTSVLIEHKNTTVVIDTGPDFRQQMLRTNVQHLDAVVFTHEHKDHIAGLDDVRAYNFKQNMEMPIYATSQVQSALIREFHYAFSEYKYPGVPELKLRTFDDDAFTIKDLTFTPINLWHYKMPVKGFRIGKLVYLTDVNRIEDKELEKIKGAEIIILDALRKEKHISHYNLEEAIELLEKLKPKKAYLIHISHLMGKHDVVMKELPNFIELAYDGLELNV
ncbi:MAG: MBL fold metallo-hydrolase [Bacteroidetes bacterium HGW-Bacteroidetes-12]|nr:MAG: MBL fold metallo-hydrolase [Bacteroidetes bacterium HGW-Bacteroidetes-12]